MVRTTPWDPLRLAHLQEKYGQKTEVSETKYLWRVSFSGGRQNIAGWKWNWQILGAKSLIKSRTWAYQSTPFHNQQHDINHTKKMSWETHHGEQTQAIARSPTTEKGTYPTQDNIKIKNPCSLLGRVKWAVEDGSDFRNFPCSSEGTTHCSNSRLSQSSTIRGKHK